MELIAITPPYFYAGEASAIADALRGDYSRVHIRKPESSKEEMAQLLDAIPTELRQLLSLHDHHELAREYGIGGIHLNKRYPTPPPDWKGIVSVSLHSPQEVTGALAHSDTNYDYLFLSPIYPSLSKPGYKPTYSFEEMSAVANPKVYALGGITKELLPQLERAGFGGAAMMTEVWRRPFDPDSFKLQFITHPMPGRDVTEGARLALEGGCRWIQLRHKDASRDTLIKEGREIARLCKEYGAIFIIDDHVDLVTDLDADGVHLGQNDMPVDTARKQLGPGRIIGATANTFGQFATAAALGADYAGIGPFRFTTTKKNLSPTLGTEGYKKIIGKKHETGIRIPIVAIGGIIPSDLPTLKAIGVDGVAASGTILTASDPVEATRNMIMK